MGYILYRIFFLLSLISFFNFFFFKKYYYHYWHFKLILLFYKYINSWKIVLEQVPVRPMNERVQKLMLKPKDPGFLEELCRYHRIPEHLFVKNCIFQPVMVCSDFFLLCFFFKKFHLLYFYSDIFVFYTVWVFFCKREIEVQNQQLCEFF